MSKSAERTRRQRQARGVLLWGILLFLTGQAALAVAIDLWLPVLRDTDFGFRLERLRGRLRRTPTRPVSVVVIGSSRTQFALNGQLIEQRLRGQMSDSLVVFNLGFTGAGPLRHWLHLNRLLREGVRPDFVLIEILPYLLHSDTGVPFELSQLEADKLRLSDLSLLRAEGLRCDDLQADWWQGLAFPCYMHRISLISMALPTLLPITVRRDYAKVIDDSGWPPMTHWAAEHRRRALEVASREHGPSLQRFHLCAATSRVLQESLELCRREGIRPALVLMPEGPTYRGLYSPESWRAVEAYLQNISAKHRVPLINAREWLDEADFWDSSHTTLQGATRFSERLSLELLPLLRGTAVGGTFHPNGS